MGMKAGIQGFTWGQHHSEPLDVWPYGTSVVWYGSHFLSNHGGIPCFCAAQEALVEW